MAGGEAVLSLLLEDKYIKIVPRAYNVGDNKCILICMTGRGVITYVHKNARFSTSKNRSVDILVWQST